LIKNLKKTQLLAEIRRTKMDKTRAKLKSKTKLVREGKDLKGRYIVEVDLERLSSLLEKEGLMDEELGEVIFNLKEYPSMEIWGKEIDVPFLPISGAYFPDKERIDIYLSRDKIGWKICQFFFRSAILNREEVLETLVHEIDHAIRLLKIKRIFKDPILGKLLVRNISGLSSYVYLISPLEILARRFARAKAKDKEWLGCVKVTREREPSEEF